MKTLITLAVSGLLATGAIAAGDKKQALTLDAEAQFTKLDTNLDSSLSEMEVAKNPKLNIKGFNNADINQDGLLSRDEFVAWSHTHDIDKQYSSAPVEEEAVENEEDEK